MNWVRKVIGEAKSGPHEIVLVCSEQAVEELLPLLKALQRLGSAGSTRGISIEDCDGRFEFDGDGNAKIDSITVDGKEL